MSKVDLSSKKLIFVTGKGGVGKSVCSAAIAWKLAQEGKKVCLFELGEQSFFESFFETRGIGYEPSEVVSGLHLALLTPESSIREYILHFLKVPQLYNLFFQNKVMKAFINAAPALSELAILGKLTSQARRTLSDKEEYDVFVVDCYSTGHAMALFRAPQGVSTALKTGNLAEQSKNIAAILRNPELVHYVLVTIPEDIPVTEAVELYGQIKNEFNGNISVICNRMMEPPVARKERDALQGEISDEQMREFIRYLDLKEDIQNSQVKRLLEIVPAFSKIPLLLKDTRGLECIERVAEYV